MLSVITGGNIHQQSFDGLGALSCFSRCYTSVLQCVVVCCSVLQCVAVCCKVLQSVAVCCSVLQRFAACCSALQRRSTTQDHGDEQDQCCNVLQRVAVSLPHKTTHMCKISVAVCCSVLQRVAACCSVMQCLYKTRRRTCARSSNTSSCGWFKPSQSPPIVPKKKSSKESRIGSSHTLYTSSCGWFRASQSPPAVTNK